MGVRILHDGEQAAMYCSTSDWAFGPIISSNDEHDAFERMQSFLRWFRTKKGTFVDPRELTDNQLEAEYSEWRAQEEAQWKREEEVEEET